MPPAWVLPAHPTGLLNAVFVGRKGITFIWHYNYSSASKPVFNFQASPSLHLGSFHAGAKPFVPRRFLLLPREAFPAPSTGLDGPDRSQSSASVSLHCSGSPRDVHALPFASAAPRGPSVSCSSSCPNSAPGCRTGRPGMQQGGLYPSKQTKW